MKVGTRLELVMANTIIMEQLKDIKNLAELLAALKDISTPMFINLCSRCGDGFLMDQIISNMQKEYGEKMGYQKMPTELSKVIKEELMISKNPVLLLVKDGEIKALFNGMSAQHRLESALNNLNSQTQNSDSV